MTIAIGTSGFAYREWKPSFYPPEVRQAGYLAYYAARFPAVEIDGTFYRMPSARQLEGWISQTPPGFRFALKASQKITHFDRLRLPSDSLAYWLRTIPLLGERLGITLYQLPPSMKPDLDRLRLFLEELAATPSAPPAAFEFRHPGWSTPDTWALLRAFRVALCITDGDDGPGPLEITAPHVYVRLRASSYPPAARQIWVDRFRAWSTAGATVYAFVKHEDNPDAPAIAQSFLEAVGAS